MITFEDWKKAIDEGNAIFYIVDKEHTTYEQFYCLGATDYVFDKPGTLIFLSAETPRKTLKQSLPFSKPRIAF